MDNKDFSNLVSSRLSAKSDVARGTAPASKFGRKKRRKSDGGDDDDDSTDDDEQRTSSRRQQQQRSGSNRADMEKLPTTKSKTGDDSTYRDRAKERREGIKTEGEAWLLSPSKLPGAAATEEEETLLPQFVSAADAKFEAVINDFETQHSTDHSTTSEPVAKQQQQQSSSSSSLLPHRFLFATADQARQWVNGHLPTVPAPRSDTAKRLVECYLRTSKPIEATPRHLSLHQTYYTFGTQWNPWWERPVVNTFLDSSHKSQQQQQLWRPLPAEILVKVGESCRRIAQREAERQQRAAAAAAALSKNHDATTKATGTTESSDEDDIFAGAGDYDAAVAIQEAPAAAGATNVEPSATRSGTSIFGGRAVAKNHHTEEESLVPVHNPKYDDHDGAMRPLAGFSEALDGAVGVDMDYEVADADPKQTKKKKKKKRRKKGDDDDDSD